MRPSFEILEDRTAPATDLWTNPAGGSWNNPNNWSLAAVPTAADDAVINLAGNPTVELDSGTVAVNSLSVSNSLVVDGGLLTSTAPIQVSGSLSVTSGNLTSSTGVFIDGGSFLFSGGSLSGTVTLHNSSLSLNGASAAANFVVNGGCTLTGNVASNQSIWVQGGPNNENATLSVLDGTTTAGNILLQSTTNSWEQSDLILNGTLTNTGTIDCELGSGGTDNVMGGELNNQGAIIVGSGTVLAFQNNGSTPADLIQQSGSITAASGSAVVFWGGSFDYTGGTISSEVVAINSTVSVADTVTSSATIEVRGLNSTLLNNASPDVTIWVQGTAWQGDTLLTVADGAINAGTILLEPMHYSWINSDMALSGTLTNTGTIDCELGSGGIRHIMGGTLVNQGTIIVGSGTVLYFVNNGNTPADLIQQSGSITAASGSAVVFWGGSFNYTGGTISSEVVAINSTVSVADTVTSSATIEVRGLNSTLLNNASPDVTIWVQGTAWQGDTLLTVADGAINAGTILLEPMHYSWITSDLALLGTLTNTGTIDCELGSGGSRNILGGTLVNDGTIEVASDTALNVSALGSGSPTLTEAGGTINANGTVTLNGGSFNFTGGSISGQFFVIGSQIDVAYTVSSPSTIQIVGSGNTLLNNYSTAVTLWVEGSFLYHVGTLASEASAENDGTILLQPTSDWWGSVLDLSSSLFNTGTIQVNPGEGAPTEILGSLETTGNINVDSGADLEFNASGATNPSLTVWDGSIQVDGNIVLNGGNFDFEGGEIAGQFLVNDTSINVAQTVTTPSTIQVVGSDSFLENNASSAVTLWVEGTFLYHTAILSADTGAVNAGTIQLQTASDWWGSVLDASNTLVNGPTGSIVVNPGPGGPDAEYGTIVNLGTIHVAANATWDLEPLDSSEPSLVQVSGSIQADGQMLIQGGLFDFEGGTVAGDFMVDGSSIYVSPDVTDASIIEVVGSGNTLIDNASVAVTLWVQGTDQFGQAVLATAPGASNAGLLLLESTTDIWPSVLDAQNPLLNTDTGVVELNQGGGGNLAIDGTLINEGFLSFNGSIEGSLGTIINDGLAGAGAGSIESGQASATFQVNQWINNGILAVDPGTQLTFDGGDVATATLSQQSGTIRGEGSLVVDDGTFAYTGGRVQGTFLVVNSNIDLTGTGTDPVVISVKGNSTLVDDEASNVTLLVQGDSDFGDAVMRTANGSINTGNIILESLDGAHSAQLIVEGEFTNSGQINVGLPQSLLNGAIQAGYVNNHGNFADGSGVAGRPVSLTVTSLDDNGDPETTTVSAEVPGVSDGAISASELGGDWAYSQVPNTGDDYGGLTYSPTGFGSGNSGGGDSTVSSLSNFGDLLISSAQAPLQALQAEAPALVAFTSGAINGISGLVNGTYQLPLIIADGVTALANIFGLNFIAPTSYSAFSQGLATAQSNGTGVQYATNAILQAGTFGLYGMGTSFYSASQQAAATDSVVPLANWAGGAAVDAWAMSGLVRDVLSSEGSAATTQAANVAVEESGLNRAVSGAFDSLESNGESGIAAAETAADISQVTGTIESLGDARAAGTALESGISDATASLNNETAVAQNLNNQSTPNCFAGEMLIRTENGKKRIDSLAVGDKVLSRSEIDATGPLELKEVERIFSSVAAIVNLHVGGQILRTTSGHPFWTQGRGWVPTSGLRLGDQLLSDEGTWVIVEGVADSGQVTTVYNLRVTDFHTYFVSATEGGCSLWAHNDYDAFAAEMRNQIPGITNAEIQSLYSEAFPNGVVTDAGISQLASTLEGRVSAEGLTAIQEAASQAPTGVSVAEAVSNGFVRAGGSLEGVLQAIEEQVTANPPTSQLGAMEAIANGSHEVGLEPGQSIGSLPGQGDVVLQNVGGIITTLKLSGEIIITNAQSQVIFRYIP